MGLFHSKYKVPPQQNKEIIDLLCEVKELKKQILSLQEINTSLENKLLQNSITKNISIKKEKPRLAKLSEEKINHFVKEILKDKNINIKYFPDFVEEKIYQNVFTILVNLLDHLVDTTSIKLLGHEINFDFSAENDTNN